MTGKVAGRMTGVFERKGCEKYPAGSLPTTNLFFNIGVRFVSLIFSVQEGSRKPYHRVYKMKISELFLVAFVFKGAVMDTVMAQVNSFAVMRYTHEAIRGAVLDCNAANDAQDFDLLDEVFEETIRGIMTHAKLEEDGLFVLIDEEFDNNATDSGCYDIHEKDLKIEKKAARKLDPCGEDEADDPARKAGKKNKSKCDPVEASERYELWAEYHIEDHLKFEENVLNPLTTKMSQSLGGNSTLIGQLVHKKILGPVYCEDPEEMAWFVGWNAKYLNKHGAFVNTQRDGKTAVRIWAQAFQYASTPSMWKSVLPALKDALGDDVYNDLDDEYGIGGDGKIDESDGYVCQ